MRTNFYAEFGWVQCNAWGMVRGCGTGLKHWSLYVGLGATLKYGILSEMLTHSRLISYNYMHVDKLKNSKNNIVPYRFTITAHKVIRNVTTDWRIARYTNREHFVFVEVLPVLWNFRGIRKIRYCPQHILRKRPMGSIGPSQIQAIYSSPPSPRVALA